MLTCHSPMIERMWDELIINKKEEVFDARKTFWGERWDPFATCWDLRIISIQTNQNWIKLPISISYFLFLHWTIKLKNKLWHATPTHERESMESWKDYLTLENVISHSNSVKILRCGRRRCFMSDMMEMLTSTEDRKLCCGFWNVLHDDDSLTRRKKIKFT